MTGSCVVCVPESIYIFILTLLVIILSVISYMKNKWICYVISNIILIIFVDPITWKIVLRMGTSYLKIGIIFFLLNIMTNSATPVCVGLICFVKRSNIVFFSSWDLCEISTYHWLFFLKCLTYHLNLVNFFS